MRRPIHATDLRPRSYSENDDWAGGLRVTGAETADAGLWLPTSSTDDFEANHQIAEKPTIENKDI